MIRRLLERVHVGERGYAMILTSLMIVPLLGFAGFAVDVGAWYSRASSLQRASDAAALAGVVLQPDFAALRVSVGRVSVGVGGVIMSEGVLGRRSCRRW